MRVLDLCCGAGLVADGLHAAGIETVGVDLYAQPSYPGPFIQHDALALDLRFVRSFDAIWASPPCLRDTAMRHAPGAKGLAHPELIPPMRRMLAASGLPYVMENVPGALAFANLTLCGSMFGLGVEDQGVRWHLQRHREFETNFPVSPPRACSHHSPVVGVYGGHARKRAAKAGGRGTREGWSVGHIPIMAGAMGITRKMTGAEISQGIPPIYAEHIGRQLLAHIRSMQEAA